MRINSTLLRDKFLPFIFLLLGLYFVPLRIMGGFSFDYIPGDLGDARFNMYILEHGFKYISGEVRSFWNADFLFPTKNVIAFSDNLLGTMPIYSFFRLLSFDKHTSFQLWILSLFTLNYVVCYIVIKKWFKNPMIAIISSYIFAFGIFNIGQIYHVQVFPRFMIPITLYWFWNYLNKPQLTGAVLVAIGTAYQFYCGIYLGFFLLYGLLFEFLAFLIIYYNKLLKRLIIKEFILHIFVSVLFLLLTLLPLFYNYLKVAEEFGLREFSDIFATIPFVSSYFFSSPASFLWGEVLYNHSAYTYDQWWLHFIFPGITPWLSLVFFPIVFFKDSKKFKKLGLFFLSFLILSFIFSIRIDNFSLYEWIYRIPGFSSMRAIIRIINLQVFILTLFLAYSLYRLNTLFPKTKYLIYLLLGFVILDNSFKLNWDVIRFNKTESLAQINHIKSNIKKTEYNNFQAVAVGFPENIKSDHTHVINYHVGVMLVCQDLNIKCVNGYTGNYPDKYMAFFDQTSREALDRFILEATDKKPEDIILIQLEDS